MGKVFREEEPVSEDLEKNSISRLKHGKIFTGKPKMASVFKQT